MRHPFAVARFVVRHSSGVAAILAASLCAPAQADEPEVTPYRPSVANPAALPAPGYFELEAGVQRVDDTGARRDSLPYLLKYAFTPDWGVLLGGDAAIRQRIADTTLSGRGDTSFVVKHRIPVDDDTAFGIEAGVKAPTAKDGLGNGKRDSIVTGIMSTRVGETGIDFNLGAVRLGAVEVGAGRTQTNWAVSFSHPVVERWSANLEFSGSRQAGTASTSQALFALAYSVSKRIVVDAGMAKGLNGSKPDSFFAGISMLLGTFK
jgi:hypothetical protein